MNAIGLIFSKGELNRPQQQCIGFPVTRQFIRSEICVLHDGQVGQNLKR